VIDREALARGYKVRERAQRHRRLER
jgi:hypothetical protein